MPLRHAAVLSRSSNEGYTESLNALADWAENSADGEAPPERIVNLVQRIGGALALDGLVVIQGYHRHPNITTGLILVPFYGVFALPLVPLEERSQVTADIYEVTSGRIVWRSRITGGVGNVYRLLDRSGRLFAQLEHAMPAVLLGEQ